MENTQRDKRFQRLRVAAFEEPEAPFKWGTAWRGLVEVFQRRQLLGTLVRRDLKSRYKDSALGLVWTLARPLTQLLVYYLVLGKFLQAERGVPDFAVYIFTGLTIYGLFSEILSSGVTSVVANSGLVKKVYLPREIFPLAAVGSALFNFLIQVLILIVAAYTLGGGISLTGLIFAMLATLVILLFGTAFALLVSALNVYLRDVQHLVEVILMVLMWASPIVYSWAMVSNAFGPGAALEVYTNNPVTLAVLGFQKAFWVAGASQPSPDFLLLRLVITAVIGLFFFMFSHAVFRKLQGNFAQVL